MRNKYNEELAELNVKMIMMGALCEDAIHYAEKALQSGDQDIVSDIYKTTSEIRQNERDIESMCTRLIMQQQPVATDLRNITSALRMIYDMERIGIQCADIGEMVEYVANNPLQSQVELGKMANATSQMVSDSVDSFIKRDAKAAVEVVRYDDEVDKFFDESKESLTLALKKNNDQAEVCLDILMIAKYFERIGDHAENIARWVYYSVTGEHLKDGDIQRENS